MERPARAEAMEELLAQTGWLRNLALHLAGDADIADDVVQDTWLAAMRHTPDTREPVRPWLAKVARNALRMRARGEGRRAAREQAVDLVRDDSGVVLAVQLDRLSIAGRVVDTSGAPVSDARVAATPVQEGRAPAFFQWIRYATTTTDTGGGFSIGDLSSGTYALQARSASGTETTIDGIRAGQRGVTITLPAPGAIEGTLVGFEQPPQVTATRVDLAGAPAPSPGAISQNSFRIGSLAPGRYAVAARSSNAAASADVEVKPGVTATATLVAVGTGTVVGRVLEFRTGQPVEGMTCHAETRVGMMRIGDRAGEQARAGRDGGFVIADAPAGDIVVVCSGLWRLYSDGLRVATLGPSQRLEIDVPVVAGAVDQDAELAGFGAEIELVNAIVPRLVQVAPRGPAAAAGFRNGDQVVAIDGASVAELSPRGVRTLLISHSPGSTIKVTVLRDGLRLSRDLTLIAHDGP